MGVMAELTRRRAIGGVMTCTSRDICGMGLWLIVMLRVLSSTRGYKEMSGWPGSTVNLLMLRNASHQRGCSKCVEHGVKVLACVVRLELE